LTDYLIIDVIHKYINFEEKCFKLYDQEFNDWMIRCLKLKFEFENISKVLRNILLESMSFAYLRNALLWDSD
jgi:hypothetical protein